MEAFKDIHIGIIIKQRVIEKKIEISRICSFMKCSENNLLQVYDTKSIDTEALLRWSKLLEYDFFRIYSQHLILYAPPSSEIKKEIKTELPQFRKNIYTKEVIDFILERIQTNNMTKKEVMDRYKIPKTTLFRWVEKYSK
ncbi:transposase [Chryseobacterium tructae]|uniref:Transposase n=1 Tax=Chryseobacterium tructae TaxID=1037380 RepID=A0ABV7XUP2_9FLAO|nr:transposase [Chryseobacterium tructae]MDN3692459.1 transposase [Chryseobacterium tructae]